MPYAVGKFAKARCARCGDKVSYLDLKEEWTGLRTCPVCFDFKHEQLEPRDNIWDPQALERAYVDNDDDGVVAQQLEDVIDMTFGAT